MKLVLGTDQVGNVGSNGGPLFPVVSSVIWLRPVLHLVVGQQHLFDLVWERLEKSSYLGDVGGDVVDVLGDVSVRVLLGDCFVNQL